VIGIMLNNIDDGGFVYPHLAGTQIGEHEGITRRDDLAKVAMQGILSNHYTKKAVIEVADKYNLLPRNVLAKEAYGYADAMIAEGNKSKDAK